MSTITFELEVGISERFGARLLSAPFRAGLASQNFAQYQYSLDDAQEVSIQSPPDASTQTILVTTDSYVSVVLGWTLNDGVVHEVPVAQLALVSLPANAQAYVRSSGRSGIPTPVRVLTTY